MIYISVRTERVSKYPISKSLKRRTFISIILFFVSIYPSMGQSMATAHISATIVSVIGMFKVSDLNFGMIPVSSTAKSIILNYSKGQLNRNETALNCNEQHSGIFSVVGDSTSCFEVSISNAPVLLTGPGSSVLQCDHFQWSQTPSPAVHGIQSVEIKATLHIPPRSVTGIYRNNISGDNAFAVTVDFN